MLTRSEFNRNISLYLEAHRFCIKNGYLIYAGPIAGKQNAVYVEINDHGKIKRGEGVYTNEEVYLKIYELALHIYKKMSNLQPQNA